MHRHSKSTQNQLFKVLILVTSILQSIGQPDLNNVMNSKNQIILQEKISPPKLTTTNSLEESKNIIPNLTGALTLERTISLFYDYVRDVGPINQRTLDNDQKTTLFAPINLSIMRLERKPHQGILDTPNQIPFPDLTASAKIARENSDLAYLSRWVSSHVIPQLISLPFGSKSLEFQNLDHHTLKIVCESDDHQQENWKHCKIFPGNIQIVGFKPASNGVIYIIDNPIPVLDN
ncbi:hypothetical protein CROQUDRAFT_670850 [Cronartium quercuum f. sp. fusiforme G11]|uniref:FAS1 domain-containing protein n=1 Tax=Cronartium quercuum f. sp. fusiforme G11 TaxID=708437 RepID=A0A9P6NNW0_9BASI|nr:hypothetical protein CROQUDRAFT_670850 [Cronartium quercuum f. sp. fusiforme G11]